jgi:hypothetical protein
MMYRPQHGNGQEKGTHRPQQGMLMRSALRVLTAVFWVAAVVFVLALAASKYFVSDGVWLSWTTGISLVLVMLCSGAIAWVEFRSNPAVDTEQGEWTNKMLFYGLVFAITFFVAFLYLPALYFAP